MIMMTAGAALKRRVITTLVRQFGHPRGIAGWLAGWDMAHRRSNQQRNIWAVSLLDVQPTDRVLEIGFGPGVAITELAARAGRGQVFGIDHSEVMVQQASQRNAAAIRAHRVHLTHASVAELPSFDEPLDAILAVNTLKFWPNPAERLSQLRRLLRPGGRIALAIQPRCPGATQSTTAQAAQELQDLLTQAGFTQIRTETLALDPPVACVLANNPPAGTSCQKTTRTQPGSGVTSAPSAALRKPDRRSRN